VTLCQELRYVQRAGVPWWSRNLVQWPDRVRIQVMIARNGKAFDAHFIGRCVGLRSGIECCVGSDQVGSMSELLLVNFDGFQQQTGVGRTMSCLGAHLADGVAPIGLPEFSESADLKGIHRTRLEITAFDGMTGTRGV